MLKEHREPRIRDMHRTPLKPYSGAKPPFTDANEARAYIKGQWGISKAADVDRLLMYYLPTLFDCPCHVEPQMQYPLSGGGYRCSNCGTERNPDGSKIVHKYVADVDHNTIEDISPQQMSLLEWKK